MIELPSEAPEDDQQRFDHETSQPRKPVCATCHYAPSNARYAAWWEWQCQHPKAALPAFYNPVTGQTVADPPRLRCKDRNKGSCQDYAQTQNVFGLKIRKKETD